MTPEELAALDQADLEARIAANDHIVHVAESTEDEKHTARHANRFLRSELIRRNREARAAQRAQIAAVDEGGS
jgi:hypothetical protein